MIFLVSQLFGPVRVILVSFSKTQQKVFMSNGLTKASETHVLKKTTPAMLEVQACVWTLALTFILDLHW